MHLFRRQDGCREKRGRIQPKQSGNLTSKIQTALPASFGAARYQAPEKAQSLDVELPQNTVKYGYVKRAEFQTNFNDHLRF